MAKLIGTAGHVDHGKTTLIRALTGIDADRLPEEKRRGMTIDLGFAFVDLPEFGRVSIVDVPGHEKFVTNMLVGALGIDVALLCVSADESVMPQTREHFQILELLPVEQMVVALTRVDLADSETRELAALEVLELLKGTRFEVSLVVPVSAHTGEGLEELKMALVQALKHSEAGTVGQAWYLPIDRVFTVKGHGAVVTGTLAQGRVQEGDQAEILPEGLRARVRTIHVHDQLVPMSEKGKRTALNLSGVKAEELRRGQAIGQPGVLHATRTLDCQVRWLHPPKHGQRIRVSIGSEEAIGKVFLNDYEPGVAQLRLETSVAAAKGQPLIVRRYSPPDLLGGGRVLVPQAKLRRKSQQVTPITQAGDEAEAVLNIVGGQPAGVTTEEVCRLQGKSPQALGDTFERLKSEGKLLGFAGLWFTPDQFELLAKKLLQALRALHEAEPVLSAHPREKALKGAGLAWQGKPLDRILSHLVEAGRLRAQGTMIALLEFKPRLNARQRELLDRAISTLLRSGVNVPSPMELSSQMHVPPKAIEEILQVGLQTGEMVRVGDDLFYPVLQIEEIKTKALSHFCQKPFTAAEFRDVFQTSRKYVIPLLEFLDSQRFTVRFGDQRVIKSEA